MNQLSIKEFYSGKSVFITGATGFNGQVLLEKLLWSCPGIENIFIIVRSKKGKNVQERVEEVTSGPCFDRIRAAHPDYLKKIIALEGDITMENLGMSPEDLEKFYEKVNVIFHSAASIRMDESVKDAINNNTMPTKRMIALARDVKNLESFVYVSTAYSSFYQVETEEKLYLPSFDPNDMIRRVRNMPDSVLEVLETDFLDCMKGPRLFPNTYTFSKNLAEALVHLEAEGIPRAIVRPSIIMSSYKEPIKGYITNWAGLAGRLYHCSIGSIRFTEAYPSYKIDLIPVDFVVNCIIAAGYKTGIDKPKEVQVYNAASGDSSLPFGDVMRHVEELALETPYDNSIAWPSITVAKDFFTRNFFPIFYHKLPAFFADLGRMIQGKKPRVIKFYQKLDDQFAITKPFIMQPYRFDNQKAQKLLKNLSPNDQKEFPFDVKLINWKEALGSYKMGLKKFMLKEDCSEEAIRKGQTKMKRLKNFHYGKRIFLLGGIILAAGGIINYKLKEREEIL